MSFITGLTEAQMRSLISVLEAEVGKKEADNASQNGVPDFLTDR
jgi:hypothetical protein